MDGFSKLSRESQVVLGGGVLLLILSFFHWQSYSIGPFSGGWSEWHGIGLLAGLLLVLMLVWEVLRVVMPEVAIGTLSPGLVSVGLVGLMALFTVIAFLDKGAGRSWPAWIALLVTIVVVAAAVMRARAEGVEMPTAKPAGAGASAGSAEPAEPAEPASSTDSADEPTE